MEIIYIWCKLLCYMGRKKKKKGVVDDIIKSELSADVIESIENQGFLMKAQSGDDGKLRYSKKSKQQTITFVNGFDLMQYNIVIKPYIIQKYHIKDETELDVLLYLYPFQFFARSDFAKLPTNTSGHSFKVLVELGLVTLRVKATGRNKNIYSLSDRAKAAVKSYYQFLSGDKTLSDDSYARPFHFQENTKVNAQRRALMLKLKRKSEHSPSIFTKGVIE